MQPFPVASVREGGAHVGVFDRFEKGIERAVNGAFARAFRAEVQPVEIASALRKAADERAIVVGQGNTLIPNVYVVELGATDHDRLYEYRESLSAEFVANIMEHAAMQGYSFTGSIAVSLTEVPDLETGIFRIQARSAGAAPGPAPAQRPTGFTTSPQPPEQQPANIIQLAPALAYAWLDIGGEKYALYNGLTIVGRGEEASIVIDDPGVSRQHVEFNLRTDGTQLVATVRDLGSTNGTFIDGQRIASALLTEGTVLTIGRTRATYYNGAP